MSNSARAVGLRASIYVLIALAGYEGWSNIAMPPVPGDVPTGYFGATRDEQGKPFKLGAKTADPVRGVKLLGKNISEAERIVRSCIHVQLSQGEHDAFTSLAFNIGRGAKGVKDGLCVLKSGAPTTLSKKVNAGDYAGACREILNFASFKGKKLTGLVKRRKSEYKICTGG